MKLLCFEGIDGSGKSTCVEMAKTFFEEAGKKVLTLKSPAILNTKLDPTEFFVVDDHTKFFLYLAQLQSIEQYLWDVRKKKQYDIVILDRFFDSSFVYSKLLKMKKSKRKIFTQILYKYYYSSIQPHMIVYCTAPIKLILERLDARKEKHKVHDLKFANKLFLERSKVSDSSKKEILIVNSDKKVTQKYLIEKVQILLKDEEEKK